MSLTRQLAASLSRIGGFPETSGQLSYLDDLDGEIAIADREWRNAVSMCWQARADAAADKSAELDRLRDEEATRLRKLVLDRTGMTAREIERLFG